MTRRNLLFSSTILLLFISLGACSERLHKLANAAPVPYSPPTTSFRYVEIDSRAGDVKLVGDIDGDGKPDLVLGGMPHEGLVWYRNPDWTRYQIATPENEFTTDGALGDVDGDGDLDIVVPDGDGAENLRWFENPRPSGAVTEPSAWQRHTIGGIFSWAKDVRLADFDGDGRLDIATRRDTIAYIFFQTAANSWEGRDFTTANLGLEGMASDDIDGDGLVDLVLRGVWLRNPGGVGARDLASWQEYPIGPAHQEFKALVADLNGDGVDDVAFSSSEGTADVVWYTPMTGDPTGAWTASTVVAGVERAHTLQASDMDGDGDLDLVVGQMHTSSAQQLAVYFNLDGQATSWGEYIVAGGGLHNGVVADVNGDGRPDIYGANWTGNPPVKLWLNEAPAWTYKEVTSSHGLTFGLAFGDVDGDGWRDIISGGYWYRSPGAGLLGDWPQGALPAGMHGSLSLDIDGDQLADIIAQKDEGDIALYWLERQADGAWLSHQIGVVPRASHDLGAQGYRAGQIIAGGLPEVAFSSGQGIFYFSAPADPAGPWPRTHVSANPSDEGFALGDVDGDGDLDIAATTGDSKRVEWYRNPGDGSPGWQAFQIGDVAEALYPDRTELADLNGDGRLDIVVSEENGGDTGAETFWWQQPADPTAAGWQRRLVVAQGTTNSMDVADIDADGDNDLILAEHRGAKKLAAWLNDGAGNFSELPIDQGKESHLGARTFDLDDDGDLEIVSIAYDDFGKLHFWRNNRLDGGQPAPTATPTTPTSLPTTTPTVGPAATPTSGPVAAFREVIIDATMAGDVKMVGDIDGDGKPDLVIGGMPGEGLNWYRNPDWERTRIATPNTEFTTDAALGDLDGDGDLDIVVPDGNGADNLVWFVNPRPAGSPTEPQLWQRRPLGGVGDWAKDVHVADFDGDGRLDVAVRSAGALKIYFQNAADVWAPLELSGRPLGLEGMASGDIDGDGHVDLVVRGAWLRNPGGAAARDNGGWTTNPIGDAPEEFKALVSDLDGDGKADVVFSSSEGTADVVWWRPGDGGPTGQWSPRTLVEDLERAHTLQAADIDGDSDNDLVVGQMHTSAARELFVLFNEDSAGGAWRKELVSAGGMHNGVVADVDGNGKPEIYGANWTGNPPLRLYVNQLGASLGLDNQVHLPAIR